MSKRQTPVLIQHLGQTERKEVLFQKGELEHHLTSKRVIFCETSRLYRWVEWLGLGRIRYFVYEETATNSGTGIRRKGSTDMREISSEPEEIYSGDDIIVGTMDETTSRRYTFRLEQKST